MYDPTPGRWTTEDPVGFAAGDANLYRYVGNDPTNETDPTGLFALPAANIKEAQAIANGALPVQEKVKDAAGPDVTAWYAYDLVMQLKHRIDTVSINPVKDIARFRDQARDTMSYKWINFGSPTEGRGVNTVVLGKVSLAKKQLGNMSLMVVGTIFPPRNIALDAATVKQFKGSDQPAPWNIAMGALVAVGNRLEGLSSADKVAFIGYSIIPFYQTKEVKNFWKDVQEKDLVYRADNLAAFGVGRLIAWKFLKELDANDDKARDLIKEKVKTAEGRAELTAKMEKVLRDVFGDSEESKKELAKTVNAYHKFQPIKDAPEIKADALFFTPDYGGLNLNSLDKKGAPIFQAPGTSIGWEADMHQEWKRTHPGQENDHEAYEKWRKEQFENWDKYSGYKIRGVKYTK